jgi:molybdate transport system substrate-binding protein
VIYRLLIAQTFVLLCLVFFQHTASAATLTVAAAANLQYALDEIKTEFKKEAGQDLQLSYGSSGKFVAQIINGAPFDVFLSADMTYPDYLYQQSYATATPKIYAYGSLVLWSIKKQDLSQWKSLLIGNSIAKIALANPKTAPYGKEALNALNYYKLDARLKPKLVFGDSISQTNQYIHSGLADIGFTAKSVVFSREMKNLGSWIEIPSESYQPIAQGAVILKHGKENNPIAAQQFYDFLSSAKAHAIFQKSGYTLP